MSSQHETQPRSGDSPQFTTTHWSVVLAAGEQNHAQADAALEKLCRTYWYPLYAYVRKRGQSPQDAQDLTQEFFARLLAREGFTKVRQEQGRFRSFLLASLKHFLSDARDHAQAQKRGGGLTIISLDDSQAEARYELEPQDHLTPELIFERRWAYALLETVVNRLRDEFVLADKRTQFEALKPFLLGESRGMTCADAAGRCGLTEAAAKMSISRMRRRYREILRDEIAHTVAHPGEIDDELRQLLAVIS